ncbi:2-oxoacid:ferredoxin oxidoreductase subunit beta [candidate division KSB1 bacterium]|nr:2-oxoacid:ferredoxin oxidoreductase subunit beta [candidate division KSB1 bacterium]
MNSLNKRAVLEGLERAKIKNKSKWRDILPTWCPGCGHFTALNGLYEAALDLKIPEKNFVVVSGIGCSGRFPFFIKGFGFHALHGRALPIATGIKIANPELTVIVVGGDGDGVGIGGGHFPHAVRNNLDITYILLDNSIYGLTKGQVSPTSPVGMISGTTPYGNIARPINPTTLALAYGATFVARVFSRERQDVSDLIKQALQHKGFSLIHDLSPCVEFNRLITYKSWNQVVGKFPEDYKADNRTLALQYAESKEPVYLGLFLKENIPTFNDHVKQIFKKIDSTEKS